jgi:outer membrane receptor for ferrienterochelin and colicin
MEVGQTSEVVTVNATADQIQTETGAKENTITAKQIDNLSIISRSAIELLRILPGVVAPNQDQLESVGFVSGANSSNQYNVNGMRGEQNLITIDGSRMMDIGANNGSIITANPDMVQESKSKPATMPLNMAQAPSRYRRPPRVAAAVFTDLSTTT